MQCNQQHGNFKYKIEVNPDEETDLQIRQTFTMQYCSLI